MTQFKFPNFLMEKGFSYSNYGDHQLYEIKVDENYYCVNVQEKDMTTNQDRTNELKTVAIPKDEKSAEAWLKAFFSDPVKVEKKK